MCAIEPLSTHRALLQLLAMLLQCAPLLLGLCQRSAKLLHLPLQRCHLIVAGYVVLLHLLHGLQLQGSCHRAPVPFRHPIGVMWGVLALSMAAFSTFRWCPAPETDVWSHDSS